MLQIDLQRLAAHDTRDRYAFVDAACDAFHSHANNRISSKAGFRLSILSMMHALYDQGIYENADVWRILDAMFRDDVTPLGHLRLQKIVTNPVLEGHRKAREIAKVLGPPAIAMPEHDTSRGPVIGG
jgi:hypothetical protein